MCQRINMQYGIQQKSTIHHDIFKNILALDLGLISAIFLGLVLDPLKKKKGECQLVSKQWLVIELYPSCDVNGCYELPHNLRYHHTYTHLQSLEKYVIFEVSCQQKNQPGKFLQTIFGPLQRWGTKPFQDLYKFSKGERSYLLQTISEVLTAFFIIIKQLPMMKHTAMITQKAVQIL